MVVAVVVRLCLLIDGALRRCLDLRCQSKRRWVHRHGLLLWLALRGVALSSYLLPLCRILARFSIVIGLVHVDILGCLSIGWCNLLRSSAPSSSSSCSSWTGGSLSGDALLFDAAEKWRYCAHKIELVGIQIGCGCGCRHIFLEFQE